MSNIQRITMDFLDVEDRMRFSGLLEDGSIVVFSVTRRLLLRLLPHLFQWLEQSEHADLPNDLYQDLAQRAATENPEEQEAVRTSGPTLPSLVELINVTQHDDLLSLQFQMADGNTVTLPMQADNLRQWLQALYSLWNLADWGNGLWPEWIQDLQKERSVPSMNLLH